MVVLLCCRQRRLPHDSSLAATSRPVKPHSATNTRIAMRNFGKFTVDRAKSVC
jgi:hypothetical protein